MITGLTQGPKSKINTTALNAIKKNIKFPDLSSVAITIEYIESQSDQNTFDQISEENTNENIFDSVKIAINNMLQYINLKKTGLELNQMKFKTVKTINDILDKNKNYNEDNIILNDKITTTLFIELYDKLKNTKDKITKLNKNLLTLKESTKKQSIDEIGKFCFDLKSNITNKLQLENIIKEIDEIKTNERNLDISKPQTSTNIVDNYKLIENRINKRIPDILNSLNELINAEINYLNEQINVIKNSFFVLKN
jgi:hypothetical protein